MQLEGHLLGTKCINHHLHGILAQRLKVQDVDWPDINKIPTCSGGNTLFLMSFLFLVGTNKKHYHPIILF